ncbi:MAG: FAD-dependent oxidoreductase [Deltaproteobacteria bacterium]|nr:FAD-dependent oxidoreductase [Deltaproteobacteria bacterium]
MILVVGGGFTGVGVSLALKEAGITDFLLLDREPEIMTQTSSNSFRLVHSGIRHLQNFNVLEYLRTTKALKELLFRFHEMIIPVKVAVHIEKMPLFLRFFRLLKNPVFEIIEGRFFKKKGFYLSWRDGYLLDPQALKTTFTEILKPNLMVQEEVVEVCRDRVITSKKSIKFKKLVLACFPSFMNKLAPVFGWNIITDLKAVETGICVGFRKRGRYLFAVQRLEGLAFGTWYTKNKPTKENIHESCRDIEEVFGITFKNYDLEIGTLPSDHTGNPIRVTKILRNDNIWEVYPAKFTTFLVTGRYVASQLL